LDLRLLVNAEHHRLVGRIQVQADDVADLLNKEGIPTRFGFDPIAQVQLLYPMARGGGGSRSLNIEQQQLLNPDPAVRRQ